MAIARDAVAVGGSTGSGSSLSWSHTCTGSNLKLLVTVWSQSANGASSVTYNSVSMTLADTATQVGVHTGLWYLDNPATGSHTVLATFSGAGQTGQSISASYTGCATGIDAHTPANVLATSISAAVTPTVDNCWVVYGESSGSVLSPSSGNANTVVWTSQNDANGSSSWSDTNTVIHPAASTTMTINIGSTSNTASVAASIAPFVSAVTHRLNLMGVGN